MKKYINIIFIFIMLLIMPISTKAESVCDDNKVNIKSIEMIDKSSNVEELDDAGFEFGNILLDLRMNEKDDYIKYKVVISNTTNEDFKLNKDRIKLSSNYLDYDLSFENDNNTIKSNSDTSIIVDIKYKDNIPSDKYINGMFNGKEEVSLYLSNGEIFGISSTVMDNPVLLGFIYVITFILIVLFTIFILKNRDKRRHHIWLLIGLLIFPTVVFASCNHEIKIETNLSSKEKTAIFDTGEVVNTKLKSLAGTVNPSKDSVNENVLHIKRSNKSPNTNSITEMNIISSAESDIKIYAWFEEDTIYYYSSYAKPFINKNASYMFSNFKNVKDIDIRNTNMYLTENLDYFHFMNENLEKINWSNMGGDNITSINNIFKGLKSLEEVNMRNINLKNVQNVASMFEDLDSLKKVDLSHANMESAISLENMFSSSGSIESIDMSYININNCKSLRNLVKNDYNLKSINFKGVNSKNLEVLNNLIYNNRELEEIDLSSLKSNNIKDMSDMIVGATKLKKVILDGLGSDNLTKISSIIDSKLEHIELISMKNFNFGSLNYESFIKGNSSSDVILDLTSSDLSKAQVSNMFNGNRSVTKLILKNAKLPTNLNNFLFNSKLENVDFTGAQSSNITSIKYAFKDIKLDDKTLTITGLENLEFADNCDMEGAFQNTSAINAKITIKNQPRNYSNMFNNAATVDGSKITVNYGPSVSSVIDTIVNTKSSKSNVALGKLVD